MKIKEEDSNYHFGAHIAVFSIITILLIVKYVLNVVDIVVESVKLKAIKLKQYKNSSNKIINH